MQDEVEVLIELLTDVLGEYHNHYESKAQISFDCPVSWKKRVWRMGMEREIWK